MYRECSEEEFNQKYYLYYKELFRVAYGYVNNRDDAEDILQNVFIKFLKYYNTFENLNHEKYWLIRVTINESLSLIRKRKNSRFECNSELFDNLPDSSSNSTENYDALRKCINSLPNKEKTIIVLYYYNSCSVEEIAHSIKLHPKSVYSLLRKARSKIKLMIEDK